MEVPVESPEDKSTPQLANKDVQDKLGPTQRHGDLKQSSTQGNASDSEAVTQQAEPGVSATPGLVRQQQDLPTSISNSMLSSANQETPAVDSAPDPQIQQGAHRETNDKDSSSVNQTDAKRNVSTAERKQTGSYKRGPRSADWTTPETGRFYRALATVGVDFNLMLPLFPDRTRHELVNKYKKEQKFHSFRVDKAFRVGSALDCSMLKKQFESERAAATMNTKRVVDKQKLEKMRLKEKIKRSREAHVKNGRGAKALQSTVEPDVNQRYVDLEDLEVFRKRTSPWRVGAFPDQEGPLSPIEVSVIPSIESLRITSNDESTHGRLLTAKEKSTIAKITIPIQAPPMNLRVKSGTAIIEKGTFVVITYDDPSLPSGKKLQGYMAYSDDTLTAMNVPEAFLNLVVST